MGMLPKLPLTIGSLCLHIDCMVTKANNYNILIDNDWLRMAGADLLLSSALLRIRLGPDQYKDAPNDSEGGVPSAHICQPGGDGAVREAIQCLEQRQPLMTRTLSQAGLGSTSDADSEYSTDLDRAGSYSSVDSEWVHECLQELKSVYRTSDSELRPVRENQ